VFYTPHLAATIPLYDGTAWKSRAFSELTLNLDNDSGHTGYHQSGKLFDCFVYDDSGTLRLGTGPAWTNDTTRSAAISRKDGRYINTSSITLRFNNGAINTSVVAANLALYVGTIYCTANGQTEDSAAKRFVWNMYNRVPRFMRNTLETTNTWSYNGTTVRYANNNSANQLAMVRGLDEDAVVATALARWTNDTVGTIGYTLIGLDSSTAAAAGCLMAYNSMAVANSSAVSHATWTGLPGLGHRTVTWLERAGGGTHVWAGDAGQPTIDQSGINGWGMA
jgi:hypothetical protein